MGDEVEVGDLIPHLDNELLSELTHLRSEAKKAEVIASKFEPRDGLYLLDRTVMGLLDGAQKHARAFHIAALHRTAEGLRHPGRFVHETLVDLFYLMLEPDPHRTAARIAVWECRTYDWTGAVKLPGLMDDPEPEIPSESSADRPFGALYVEWLAEQLEDSAEGDLLLEVFDECYDGRPAYHWSGKGRFEERLRSLEGRMQRADPEGADLLRRLLAYQWHAASLGSHPRAGWMDVIFETVDVESEFVRYEVGTIQAAMKMLRKRASLMLTTPLPWGSSQE